MLRIAITGSQGTGKTTLARGIARTLSGSGLETELLEGIGTTVAQPGLPLGREATEETICAFAAAHLRRERTARRAYVVQDRCLLDLLAYCRALRFSEHLCSFVREAASMSLAGCLVCYLRASSFVPVPSSPVEDDRFREVVAAAILESAADLGIGVHVIDGTIEQRVMSVMSCMRSHLA